MKPVWYVYVLYSTKTGKLYTGITIDPERRLWEHNHDNRKGAKATRAGRPWVSVRIERAGSKSVALKREAAIKKMQRADKLLLVGISA
jgi:putative endonuclease